MPVERAAGLAETVFVASHVELAGSTQSVMAAELDEPLPAPALVAALRRLHRRQPMLRARLAGEAPCWRFVFDVAYEDVEVRAMALGSGPLEAVFAAECDNALDLTRGPLWRVLLVTGHQGAAADVVAVVVTFAHAIVDGRSGITFMRQLVGADRQDPTGERSLPLPPPLEEVLPAPTAAAGSAPPAHGPTGEWPFGEEVAPDRRRTNVVLGRVDADTLERLRRACRARQVTVDGLFVSTVQLALSRRIPAALSLPVLCAFDARPALDPPVPADQIGMYMKDLQLFDPDWATGPPALWERARRVSQLVSERRSWALAQPATRSAAEMYELIRLAATYPMKSFQFSFSVSNLGRQSSSGSEHPSFRSLYLSSTDRVGIMGFQLVLTELRGELFMTFVHADPLIAPSTVTTLRDDVTGILRSVVREGVR